MCHKLKEGAILIADSHYPNHKAKEFLELLNAINSNKIKTSQIIFMGDNFDLLVGNSPYLKSQFKNEIKLIEQIATKIEIIYLEGNHDFYLKPLFKNVKIIPIQKQPLILSLNNKKVALSHGDKYNTTLSYKLYTKLIRNPFILKILPDYIAKYKLVKMQNKSICKKIANFKLQVKKLVKNYNTNIIIEGHFHQGVVINNYISLPSFACNLEVAIVKKGKIIFEKIENLV